MLEGWEMGNVALEPQERAPVFARREPDPEDEEFEDLEDEELDEDEDEDEEEEEFDDDDEEANGKMSVAFEDRHEDR